MSTPLDELIWFLELGYGLADLYKLNVYNRLDRAGDKLIAGDLVSAGWELKGAATYFEWCIGRIIDLNGYNEGIYTYLLPHILNELREPEITYQQIVEAWGRDDFEGRAVTIAFIDRMRQLIWNEPYSAIWAAKPEEEEL